MSIKMPEGKYMATVKIGEKGQIVIPKGARELFGIRPGDSLLLMADKKRGIALVAADELSAPAGLFELAKEAEDEDEQNSDG